MGRTSEIQQIITCLRDTASSLSDIASRLYEFFSADETQEQTAVSVAKPLTLEEVRAVCAEKSRAGFTAEVKAIITKYGADKLSAVKPEDYAAVLAEVEVLSNAD